jgi:hypothetical protein
MPFKANLHGINTGSHTFEGDAVLVSGVSAREVSPTSRTYLDTLRHNLTGARVAVRHHEKGLLRLPKRVVEIEVAGS